MRIYTRWNSFGKIKQQTPVILMKPVRGEVIVKAINLSPEQRQRLKDYPAYISVTDVT